ncbi:MAG: glycosidase [Saprospirales bacterium]|nr:glycosidase [Saprospirales bacterium]
MKNSHFENIQQLLGDHEAFLSRPNQPCDGGNGVFTRWQNPVVTAAHTPVIWRYDLDPATNPRLLERQGVNAAFNAGAIFYEGRYLLCVRVEGADRKSFFAIAESSNGVDNFRFWDYPVVLPETDIPDTNVYDMRLVLHEDGWIYGQFCTERKDPAAPKGDTSQATAQGGLVRTRDLKSWERLPDLQTPSSQQRNVVLHPEFVGEKYAFYTRPQDGFIDVGGGGGIGWGLSDRMNPAILDSETIIDQRVYHTIKEVKNGQGPAPLRSSEGWLHLAHGVRNTAAGLRYVLYLFITALDEPWRVTHAPAGYFLAPEGEERTGDVSNVVFSNGWLLNPGNDVFIYYGASDTRMHVATSTLDKLVDYCLNTPPDGLRSAASVHTRINLIERNLTFLKTLQQESS